MSIFDKLFGDQDASQNKQSPSSTNIFDNFIKTYKPSADLIKPTQQMLDWFADKLPKELLDFWVEYGFGNYGGGLIKVVEPTAYMDSFYTWLGKQDFSKLPILVTGFGDIFYYRKLSEKDEDVSLLDIHYRQIDLCDYSLKGFFENYIVDPEIAAEVLKTSLFEQAVEKLGPLNAEEIYFFVPALAIGGGHEIKYVNKGNGSIHQSLLHQLGG